MTLLRQHLQGVRADGVHRRLNTTIKCEEGAAVLTLRTRKQPPAHHAVESGDRGTSYAKLCFFLLLYSLVQNTWKQLTIPPGPQERESSQTSQLSTGNRKPVRYLNYGKIQIFCKSCSDNNYISKYDMLNGI